MSRTVNVNFRMDEQLKHNVEDICRRMGMNLTTALTIFCRKLEQERRIPFEITAEADPFYSDSNIRVLQSRYDDIKNGKTMLQEYELFETD